jgi:hypothetical protein
MTDFNDLALENARLAKQQLEEAVWRARQRDDEQTGETVLVRCSAGNRGDGRRSQPHNLAPPRRCH